jgi:hypothetical protein
VLTDRRDNGAVPQLHYARRSVRGENRCDVATNRQRQTDRAKCIKVAPAELSLVHLGKDFKRLTFWAGQLQVLGEPGSALWTNLHGPQRNLGRCLKSLGTFNSG